MGTVHHLAGLDDRQARTDDRSAHSLGDLEMPGWEDFTTARDRFFAGLRSAAELYRNGEITPENVCRLEDATD